MKTTLVLLPLFYLLTVVVPLRAQEPSPAATPDDIPVSKAPAAQPTATPAPAAGGCPMCGMAKGGDGCKDDDKPAKSPANDQTDLTQLEQKWAEAIVHTDLPALERIVAEEYTSVGPDGTLMNKAEHLDSAKAVAGQISSFKFTGVQVHVYGETAVVTGDGMIHWADSAPDALVKPSAPFRWTDVFVKRDGRWQAVASQATNVAKTALTSEN